MRVGDLDALEKALECQCNKSWDGALDFDQIKEVIDNAPPVPQVTVFTETADEKAVVDLKSELQNVIESRPKGKWINIDESEKWKCSECGRTMWFMKRLDIKLSDYNYCPNCGADMRGGVE